MAILSNSAAQTKKIGRVLGKFLSSGDVVALEGELGAGKTTLVQGIAKGLGFDKEKTVASPTFAIMHEYHGREEIHHLDWYRLDSVKGPDAELAEDCFEKGVTLIEWPERGRSLLPVGTWRIKIEHRGPASRRIHIHFPLEPAREMIKALKAK